MLAPRLAKVCTACMQAQHSSRVKPSASGILKLLQLQLHQLLCQTNGLVPPEQRQRASGSNSKKMQQAGCKRLQEYMLLSQAVEAALQECNAVQCSAVQCWAYCRRGAGQVADGHLLDVQAEGILQGGVPGGGVSRVLPPDGVQHHCRIGCAACKRAHLILHMPSTVNARIIAQSAENLTAAVTAPLQEWTSAACCSSALGQRSTADGSKPLSRLLLICA